jgi:two-component system chemotaxis response regulator CheY
MAAKRFDVVISDFNMPGMSGVELAQKIKAHPVLKSIPVFLATSNAYRDQAGDAVDHFVAKPFVVPDLREALEAHLGKLS